MLPLLLKGCGVLLIGISFMHLFLGKRFHWEEELARLSLLNRQIFRVHCFFIAFTVAMMGALALFFTDELLAPTPLGRIITGGLTAFWAVRMLMQWFVYDAALWRGHRFNTAMHVLFSAFWIVLTGVFGWSFYFQCTQLAARS